MLGGFPERPSGRIRARVLGLKSICKVGVGPGVALNHYKHAKAAKEALVNEVQKDLQELGKTPQDFEFFMAFSYEIVDRYGRLLGYINRDQPSKEGRPLTYNERLLKAAVICLYFIWPNINPFKKSQSIVKAVIEPGHAANVANRDSTLRQARQWLQDARKQKIGIFAADGPLRIEPFKVRYLAGRRAPNR
ncbi:MAG: hypothetical protein LUO89_05165 [Methanothrix sp.]|nr:hypothetical protein [Methanothrix sp.]